MNPETQTPQPSLVKTVIWLVVLMLVVGVIWYGNKKNEEPSVIKIGGLLSLTGNAASFGEQLKNGIELAREEINADKTSPFDINIVYEDDKSENVTSVSAFNKLIAVDGVSIVLGPVRSSSVLALAPIANEKKVVIVTSIASGEDITQAGDFIFRNRERAGAHGIGMARYLREAGIQKVAVFTAKAANSKGYSASLVSEFEALGGTIVSSAEYEEKATDFHTELLKIKKTGAEALYISATLGNDAGLIAKQARDIGYAGLLTGSAGIESQEFLTASGKASENVLYTSPAFDSADPKVAEYKEKYLVRYGSEANAFSANAYDALNIIAEGIRHCEGTDSLCIRDYLYGVKEYPGIGGVTTFDENGDVVKTVTVKTIKDGKFVDLK
ncbi:MAG: ABC transporter substrate-binding protein [bacterium]|nr:ABC transporter substrate-binding protein [bacterium]